MQIADSGGQQVTVAHNPGAQDQETEQQRSIASIVLNSHRNDASKPLKVNLSERQDWQNGVHNAWRKKWSFNGAWLDFSSCKPCSLFQVRAAPLFTSTAAIKLTLMILWLASPAMSDAPTPKRFSGQPTRVNVRGPIPTVDVFCRRRL